jgi:transposase
MRGEHKRQATMLSVIGPEERVPQDHPIRRIKALADAELKCLSPTFDAMYSRVGRPSIPPERLLKACLLIALYSIRSERQFCERLNYDLLFRFFLDMNMIDDSFDASTFAKNKERLLAADVARLFFDGVVRQAKAAKLMSAEHFTVDGTLIEAWASMKSFRPKDEDPSRGPDDPGNPTVNFRGETRSNDTHESTTDPEARLARKGMGKEAKLAFSAHVMMENRNGLVVDIQVAEANGTAERMAAMEMLLRQKEQGMRPQTLGADKGYDAADFVEILKEEGVTPHVAQNISGRRGSNIDGRTTRHPGYAASQRIRKRVEEIFGWMKTVGNFRKTRYRGQARTGLWAYFEAAAYNLVRMAKLMPA